MTTVVIDEYIRPTLTRYIDQYHLNWSKARRLINLYYGTEYTEKQLKKLYRQAK